LIRTCADTETDETHDKDDELKLFCEDFQVLVQKSPMHMNK